MFVFADLPADGSPARSFRSIVSEAASADFTHPPARGRILGSEPRPGETGPQELARPQLPLRGDLALAASVVFVFLGLFLRLLVGFFVFPVVLVFLPLFVFFAVLFPIFVVLGLFVF